MVNMCFITASMKKLTSAQKSVILTLKEENYSARAIAKRIGCSHVSILKFYKPYDATKSLDRAPVYIFKKYINIEKIFKLIRKIVSQI